MAVDIIKSISGNAEKHGCPVVLGARANPLNNNTITDANGAELCLNAPTVASIEEKYDTRFDDPTYYGGGGVNSLSYLLKASYRLDEVSGTRRDRNNSRLDLTDNNTVGSIAGKQDTAASFVSANVESLSLDNASLGALSPGDTDFSVGFWVYLDSGVTFSSDMFVAGIWKTSGNHREWMFLFTAGDAKINFRTSSNGSDQSSIVSAALSADTWYNIVGTYSSSDGKKLYVNNSLASSTSDTGVNQGDGAFIIGAFENNTTYLDGRVDEFNMWHRTLSTDNISDFYNSGNGKHVR